MKKRTWIRCASLAVLSIAFLTIVISVGVGYILSLPAKAKIGKAPADFSAEAIQIKSGSGNVLSAWFVPGTLRGGAVLLLHGVRGNRLSMLDRARFLKSAGYALLLLDLSAHGESEGGQISFGGFESLDVVAAVQYLRERLRDAKIGVIGVSLGGVSLILATGKTQVDAIVIESVYPTFEDAVVDRLTMRLGPLGPVFAPLLTMQLKPRLGLSLNDLRPIDKIHDIKAPIFVLAGTNDLHTKLIEAQSLFAAANEPKEFWAVDGAAHVDLHHFAPREYERKVLRFLQRHLGENTGAN